MDDVDHHLGAVRSAITFADLEMQYQNDTGFADFQKKVSIFLTGFLPVFGVDVPSNVKYPLKLLSHEKVSYPPKQF